MEINSIRLANINALIDRKANGVRSEFARMIGREPVSIGRWWITSKNKRNIGSASARAIEKAMGLSQGWLDMQHDNFADLEQDPQKKQQLKLQSGENHSIPLESKVLINKQLALTKINTNLKGQIMLLSTDRDVYGLQFIGHNENDLLSEGWGLIIEPSTSTTEGEYALIQLDNRQLLLRKIAYQDDENIIVTNPFDKTQYTLPRSRIIKAEYCYIGIPPSKILSEK